jgi:uncharacterized lipoprotein YmbA
MSVHRRDCLRGFLGVGAAALTGCAATPTNYYRLAAVPGPIRDGATPSIGVRSVSIPGYLDQTNIVKPGGAYSFDTYANELWAGPLADMLQAVMVQDLAQRLPQATVIGSGGAIGAPAGLLVEINVLRFDPDAGGQIALLAQIAVKSGADQNRWTTRSYAASAPGGVFAVDNVAAMSRLWGSAADQVAAMIVQNAG